MELTVLGPLDGVHKQFLKHCVFCTNKMMDKLKDRYQFNVNGCLEFCKGGNILF